jgi:hypothetical protein
MDFDSLQEDSQKVSQPSVDAATAPGQSFDNLVDDSEKYATLGQQAIATLEGAGRGLIPGFSAIERGLGVSPEGIAGRQAENPIKSNVAEVGGFVLPAILSGGSTAAATLGTEGALEAANASSNIAKIAKGFTLPGISENLGNAAAKAAGLAKPGTSGAAIAAGAIRGATEFPALQANTELNDWFTNKPPASVGAAAVDMGLAGLMGGALGGTLGKFSPLWKETVAEDAGKMIDGAKASFKADSIAPQDLYDSLKELKPNAPEIKAAADDLGAGLLESQVSASQKIQKLDSMMLNNMTLVGSKRSAILQDGINKANQVIDDVLGKGTELSPVEVGNNLKKVISDRIDQMSKPINDLYAVVKESTQNIPVSERAKNQIAANIRRLEDYKFKDSATRMFGDNAIEALDAINSVDDLKRYQTILNKKLPFNASGDERFAVGQIVEKLKNLEENSILRAANELGQSTKDPKLQGLVTSLIDQRKQANEMYKGFLDKVQPIADVTTGGKIGGAETLKARLSDIPPERLAQKIFSKNNAEALQATAKNFPEAANMVFDLQKAQIRNAVMKDGSVNAGSALKKINALPKEVRELMFTKEQLGKMNSARVYLESIPPNINPLGTSHADAMRKFFSNPLSASLQNATDYGLSKAMAGIVPMSTLEKTIGPGAQKEFFETIYPKMHENVLKNETNPDAFKTAAQYGVAVSKGQSKVNSAVSNFFKAGGMILNDKNLPNDKDREQIKKSVSMFNDPQNAFSVGNELAHYLPEHGSAVAQVASNAVNYLNQIEPKTMQSHPLDKPAPVSRIAETQYQRALDTAQQPLMFLHHAKNGTMTDADLNAARNMWPDLYQEVTNKISQQLIEETNKGTRIPYHQKVALSKIIGGNALTASVDPVGAQTIMMANNSQNIQNAQNNQQKSKKASKVELDQIDKTNKMYATRSQEREMSRKA